MNHQPEQDKPVPSELNIPKNADLSRPVERRVGEFFRPVDRFIQDQTSGALLLIIATFAAMVMVNSSWHDSYQALEKLELGISAGEFELKYTLHHWVNDGLMVMFFFLLGLEIKREFIAGELSNLRTSAAVIFAAMGGMFLPALFYAVINLHAGDPWGWVIPMATALSLKLGLGELPSGMKLSDVVGIGLLAGMGFTMSIFIGVLSFSGDLQTLLHAKTGIMLATFLAGILGLSWMWLNSSKNPTETSRA